jgi:8-oxo-dGTP pyrophosphatase MutT (NUDIX family)
MISKKLEQLKTFLQKEGGGDGGGFAGTAFTVDSSGFVPTYSGGDDKKPKKKTKKNTPESFAEELMKFAIDKSMELKKNMSLGIGHKDMRNTDLGQSTRSGDNRKYTRTADVGGNNQYKVLNPPEIPFEHDAVLNWEDLFQKAETDDLQITAKVLIRDESNKVLILKDRFSDWWDLPGGHIHTEETPEEGALREVEEETGIKLNEVDLVIGQEVDTDLGHRLGLFLVAYVPLDSPKPLLSDEHTDYAWIGMDETYYYNLGVWEPIIRYVLRFISEGAHENLGQLYVETQSDALDRLDKAVVIHTDESGDKTALASGGVYLVKSDGKVFKQEPWPASEETGDLLNIEEDDFLENQSLLIPEGKESDFHWVLEKWKAQPIPMQFYRPVTKEHQNIISRPFKILLGTPDNYVIAEPPPPNSSEVLDGLEQVQMDFRYLPDKGKDRLEEVVNKSDTTMLRLFREYARDHGLRVDLYESLLEDILADVNTIVMDKKYKINYPRPWQYEMDEPYFIYDVVNAIRPSIDTPSYPSGHSTQALVIAEILGNMYPNHLENFREIADDIGINRVKAGWHFPMDHTAGKKLALEIVDTLPDSMELEKDRVYLKPGQASPEGVQVKTGPAGGKYYDAEVDPSITELEGSDRGKPDDYESVFSPNRKPSAEGRKTGKTGGFDWEMKQAQKDSMGAMFSPDKEYVQGILKSIGMDVEEYKQKWISHLTSADADSSDVFK